MNEPLKSTTVLPNILFVCDFFFPSLGGVESHIFQLGNALIALGYRVIVATHQYNDRQGIRFLEGGLKVYYLPFPAPIDNVTFPALFTFLPLLRQIIIREDIHIVHGHQGASNTAVESLMHSRLLGCYTVFTDHSLFGFNEIGGIHVNKLLQLFLPLCHRLICVSHTCRENLVIRACLRPSRISVIPNALNAEDFKPNIQCRPSLPIIRVIVLCRMTFRKGVDLLVHVIPAVCARHPFVEFVIGGDGPKRLGIEEMRDRYRLYSRIKLLGAVSSDQVVNVLKTGHIFLNCSLTEAFCIAVVEAAACGMKVVTTNVGGIPEVLPSSLLTLCPPTVEALTDALLSELNTPPRTEDEVLACYESVRQMYSWDQVAKRTAIVYEKVLTEPPHQLIDIIQVLNNCGTISGKLWILITMFDVCLIFLLNLFYPVYQIKQSPPLHPKPL